MAAIPFIWPTFLSNPAHQAPFFQSFRAETQADAKTIMESREPASSHISKDAVRREVLSSVESILGAAIGENIPLVQAGLDSLGMNCSKAKFAFMLIFNILMQVILTNKKQPSADFLCERDYLMKLMNSDDHDYSRQRFTSQGKTTILGGGQMERSHADALFLLSMSLWMKQLTVSGCNFSLQGPWR